MQTAHPLPATLPRWWAWLTSPAARWLTLPLTAFLVTRALVFGIVLFADVALPNFNNQTLFSTGDLAADYLRAWHRWDTVWYVEIAGAGYRYDPASDILNTVTFFPLYPVLLRAFTLVTGHPILSGLLISNGCFLAALVLLYRLTARRLGEAAAGRTVFFMAAFPYAFFFSGVYTESLFLLLTLLVFLNAEEGKWGHAALAGLLATITRPTGVLMALVVLLMWLAAHGWSPRAPWPAERWRSLWRDWQTLLWIGVIPLGLAGYMAYLWSAFGSPFVFSAAQSTLRQPNGLQPIINDITLMLRGQLWPGYILDLCVAVVVLLLVAPVGRRLGLSYAVYVLLSAVIPLLSGVMSFTRYAMVLFPLFMLAGLWVTDRRLVLVVRVLGLFLLPVCTLLFVKWVFLG